MSYLQHAQALYQALQPDPYFSYLESLIRNRDPAEAMLAYYDYSMREAALYGRLYLPQDGAYGVSVWLKPLDHAEALEKARHRHAFIETTLGANCLAAYVAAMEEMSRHAGPIVDPAAWYLSIVGVLPEQQNQGRGESLLAPVLATTDRLGLPTYLETFTDRNRSFYGRLGYQVAGEFTVEAIPARYALMIRPAQPDQPEPPLPQERVS